MFESQDFNNKLHKGGQLFTFFSLYIAQKIPMTFLATVIPVMMRQQNFSLETIGMLQLLKLPWILKFLWSPMVDRSCNSLSDYKVWIFSSEMIYAIVIFAIAFLDLQATPILIIVLVIMAFIASATQDIATDALAVISFKGKDRSLVNSMQSIGGFAGSMIGGGIMLILYNKLGWSTILPLLSVFVVLAIIPIMFFKHNDDGSITFSEIKTKPGFNDLGGFFRQKGIWKQVIFLLLYYAGITGTLSMVKPLLVDYGYNMHEIGVMSGVVGISAGCVGSLTGGFIVRKIGRYWSRILFAGLIFIGSIYFHLLLTHLSVTVLTLHIGISLIWLSYGMATIVVYTTAMDCVRKSYEGTDFTLQTVITHLSGMLMAIGAGKLADETSYATLFSVEMCIAATSLIYILLIFKNNGKNVDGKEFE
ncbi:muropeptide transporter [Bacteroidales bacterium]|nr:muropeptide transporter [Bacteroidales bacterium]